MKIAIGNDHVAIELKNIITQYLKELGHEVINVGTDDSTRTDYPIYSKKVAKLVLSKKVEKGILICGTGVGISLAANKYNGIRAVVCSDSFSAKLSREHNDTNILSFGSRVVGSELAKMIVKTWLDAEFEGGRHQKRIDMINEIERDN